MNRRLKQIVLPVVLFSILILLLFGITFLGLKNHFRTLQNAEMANIIGGLAVENADLDISRLVGVLQSSASITNIRQGQEILQQYGYQVEDFVSMAAETFVNQTFMMTVLIVLIFMILIIAFFWIRDYSEQHQIKKLVEYLHILDRQVHDLKLSENTEGQLSILTNELYKIMVTLKTAAANNQAGRKNLETALADISHQLRTPLTSLQIMIDNIYHEPDMPENVRQDFLQSISRQLEQMSTLVTTLLNLAKFDNKTIKLNDDETTVQDLFDRVLQKLAVLADLSNITIEFSGDLQAKIRLDAHWQAEALSNIVKNCLEHSPENSKIILSAENCPLFLKIVIQDFGEGIARQDLRHIFERFYKAKNSTKTSVGIGLSFAKTIIEADNGQVTVKSEEGQGTIFTIKYFK